MTPWHLRERLAAWLLRLLFGDSDKEWTEPEPKPVEEKLGPAEEGPLVGAEAASMFGARDPRPSPTGSDPPPRPLEGSAEERLARLRMR